MVRNHLVNWMRHFSTAGLLVATLLFAFSLTPSLVPRTTVFQGLVSGLSITAGYAVGIAGRWLWFYLELPTPSASIQRTAVRAAAAICLIIASAFLWRASEWQNSVRMLMGMEPVTTVRPISVGAIALLVFVLALLSGRPR